MAEKQKVLLSEMFGSLQSSIEAILTLMSLFLVEFIGYEMFATFVISWLVILFLPQFRFSRFKLHLVLFANLFLGIVIRRLYGYFVLGGAAKSPPDSLVSSSVYYVVARLCIVLRMIDLLCTICMCMYVVVHLCTCMWTVQVKFELYVTRLSFC